LSTTQVLAALLADSWLHQRGVPLSTLGVKVRQQLMKAFYRRDADWRTKNFARALENRREALAGLGSAAFDSPRKSMHMMKKGQMHCPGRYPVSVSPHSQYTFAAKPSSAASGSDAENLLGLRQRSHGFGMLACLVSGFAVSTQLGHLGRVVAGQCRLCRQLVVNQLHVGWAASSMGKRGGAE